jgi:hypothetical protein
MMAAGVLKGSGLDDAERSKAKEAWLDLPAADVAIEAARRRAEDHCE